MGSLSTRVPFYCWKFKMIFATSVVSMYMAVSRLFQFVRCTSIRAFINIQTAMEVPALF